MGRLPVCSPPPPPPPKKKNLKKSDFCPRRGKRERNQLAKVFFVAPQKGGAPGFRPPPPPPIEKLQIL